MSLSHEHVGSKIPAKINTSMLNRAELLITLCYETPCITRKFYYPVKIESATIYSASLTIFWDNMGYTIISP